jgi:hypothetical protein
MTSGRKLTAVRETLWKGRLLKLLVWLPVLLFTSGKSISSTEEIIPQSKRLVLKIHVSTNFECFSCEYQTLFHESYEITRDDEKTAFSNMKIIIPTNLINCNNILMNKDLRLMLKSSEYPEIRVDMADFFIRNTRYNMVRADALITMVNIGKQYSIPITSIVQNDHLFLQGSLQIQLSDFGISPPTRLLGLVKVGNSIDIQFGLTYSLPALQRASR